MVSKILREPAYIQVGVIYPTYDDAVRVGNICGYRVFRVEDLKFISLTKADMKDLIKTHQMLTFAWGNYEVDRIHNKYIKDGNDVKYIDKLGGESILLGYTSNSYLVTDGSELLKLYDINDLVDANVNGVTIPRKHFSNVDFKMLGIHYVKDRRLSYLVDYGASFLDSDNDSGFEVVTFDKIRKSGHDNLDKINSKIALLDLGYEITPNGDVVVTNSDSVVNFVDFNAMKSLGKYMGLAGCKNLRSFFCGSKLKIIYKYAFADCVSLTNVTLTSVRLICDYAFENCSSLEKIEFGSSLIEIHNKAFLGCSNLKEVTLPPTVKFVATTAFDKCKKLEVIHVKSPELYAELIRAQKNSKCFNGVAIIYKNS